MTIYDRVKDILENDQLARNNDRHLMMKIWEDEIPSMFDFCHGRMMMDVEKFVFNKLTASSTVKRARRKVQSDFPELRATSERVKRLRQQKEKTKGDFIYNDWWK